MTRPDRGSTKLGIIGVLVAGVALVAIALRLLLPAAEGEAGAGDVVSPADGAAASAPVPPPSQVAERQHRAAVMRDDEARGAAVVDVPEPEGEVIDGPATRLDRIGASFLSADPDFADFNEFHRWLAIVAEVVPESVEVDPETGVIHGRLSIPGSSLKGTFEIDGDAYRVGIDSGEAGAVEEPFMRRDMTVLFDDSHGAAADVGAVMQFHPDMRQRALLPTDEERYVGWSLSASDGGRARPLSIRKNNDGQGWIIGHAVDLPQQQGSWLLDTTPHQLWLDKLKHHK